MNTSERLTFREVDIANYYPVMKLEMVPGQERFLDSNAWPLAEAAFVTGFKPEAVYLGETLIGLVSWGPYYPDYGYEKTPETGSLIIDHIMIAAPFQARGLGRRATEMLVEKLRQVPGCQRIVLMLHPQNGVAEKLYASLGFIGIGTTHEDDLIMAIDVEQQA
jgi:diamine N-acetyltransferase